MYEFHGIKWLNDNELDPDDPARRGPGWSHAYVPIIGPAGDEPGTAHVPIYMPRVYKELKRFALQVYRAAGGTSNNVEMSGWWSDIKKGFKKIAQVVASNKVLRAVAEKGLEAAVPGGASVSEGAAKVLEDLVSKYRGGQGEAANQIKSFLEKANGGDEQSAKVLDAIRREYTKQQAAGLPALIKTMASGDVVVYDPIVGAKRKMRKKQVKKVNQQRKREAAQQRKQPQRKQQRTSPLRNSSRGPVPPGTRAQQLRQGMTPGERPAMAQPGMLRPAVRPAMASPNMLRPGMSPGGLQAQPYAQPQQPYGYPQQPYAQPYPYPQQPYGYPSSSPQYYDDGGSSEPYYDPEQDADDEADLQAAAEENLARLQLQTFEDEDEGEDEGTAAGEAYYDVGANLTLTPEEAAQWKRLPKAEQDRLKKGKPEEIRARLRSMGAAQQRGKGQQQRERQRGQQDQKYRADQQKKERERMVAQAKRDREANARRQQGAREQAKQKQIDEINRRSAAAKRVNERLAESQEYEDRIADLEEQAERHGLDDAHRADLRAQAAQFKTKLAAALADVQRLQVSMPPAPPPPPLVYDEERGEEYDTDDPLVREALRHMEAQQAAMDEDNEG